MSLSTPCPAPYQGSSLRRLSISSLQSDTMSEETANIEFTRAFKPELIAAKPRRRSSLTRRVERHAPVTVFEDVPEEDVLVLDEQRDGTKSTLLSKPARKLPGRVSQPPPPTSVLQVPAAYSTFQRDTQQARRSSILPKRDAAPDVPQEPRLASRSDIGSRIKESRRRTIFIPEDTTILSIHPGAQHSTKLDDTFNIASALEDESVDCLGHLKSNKPIKGRRRSLAAAPKRMPLMDRPDVTQNILGFDVPGSQTGKENKPPVVADTSSKKPRLFDDIFSPVQHASPKEPHAAPRSDTANVLQARSRQADGTQIQADSARCLADSRKVAERRRLSTLPTLADGHDFLPPILSVDKVAVKPHSSTCGTSLARRTSLLAQPTRPVQRRQSHMPTVSSIRAEPKSLQSATRPSAHASSTQPVRKSPRDTRDQLRAYIATKRHEQRLAEVSKYPVLSEDVPMPELYEESWLTQQEVGLTEVVNEIFARSESQSTSSFAPGETLREQLIQLYHSPEVALLHRSLQSSLQFGALSRPKDSPVATKLDHDVGLRKNILNLWLSTYDETTLRAAAEVIVGRQIISDAGKALREKTSAAAEALLDPQARRRPLIRFLETFFISAGDVELLDHPGALKQAEESCWNKVMLRSLMLIWLLDKAKCSGDLETRLFKCSSSHKSSASVLQAFCHMLLPSIGDYSRALKYKAYELHHVQSPVDELSYHITNLAVDLRDGVMLARLVELFLYDPTVRSRTRFQAQNSVTIRLPDNTILESKLHDDDSRADPRILTRHLSLPCNGYAQRVYNVQIALSALEDSGVYGANIVAGINASNIVDGHREKTISLLWSLVSGYGLRSMVPWKHLITDTNSVDPCLISHLPDLNRLAQSEQENLLQAWATAHASIQGLRVANLTTSFADGKIYLAIIAAFISYLPPSSPDAPKPHNLRSSLRALGCSEAFTNQLASHLGLIPSRETTLSNLAFLASRLLPLAQHARAASMIQRVWRRRLMYKETSKRVLALRCAHACAVVVNERAVRMRAAVVLQRAWRAVVDARIARLERDVVSLQAMVRGWIGRGGVARSYRVLGGW